MVTSSIARNETNRILENAIGNVRSYSRLIWPVCRFKTRDFAFVLPLLVAAWYRFHTDNFDRRNKGKVFLFFQLHANLRVSILFFSFFPFSFYTKNSRIHPFDIGLRRGGEKKGRKNSSVRDTLVAQKTTNPFEERRIIVRVRGNERVSPSSVTDT